MERSRRLMLCAALGLSLSAFACGDSGDSKGDEGTDGDDSADGGGSSDDDNTGGGSTGDSSTGGSTGSTGNSNGCTAPGQQCMCTNGMMGFQACTNGMLGDCTCGIDLSDAGLPPPSMCAADATCQSTRGIITGVEGFCSAMGMGMGMGGGGGIPGIPPTCTAQADCVTAGLPDAGCVKLMLPVIGMAQVCLQPCTPAP